MLRFLHRFSQIPDKMQAANQSNDIQMSTGHVKGGYDVQPADKGQVEHPTVPAGIIVVENAKEAHNNVRSCCGIMMMFVLRYLVKTLVVTNLNLNLNAFV
jgi:hypothetical protein